MALLFLFFQFLLLIIYSDVVISPTYRYFLRPKDICVFLAYLYFGQSLDTLNKSVYGVS